MYLCSVNLMLWTKCSRVTKREISLTTIIGRIVKKNYGRGVEAHFLIEYLPVLSTSPFDGEHRIQVFTLLALNQM